MRDYMKKIAQKGAQQNTGTPVQAKTNGIPNSALQDVFAGKRRADSSMMGHSQNLAPSIAAKMSRSFGMDLTGMQVYRSDAMVGSGMQGMAQGNKVVLSSDVDLNTTAGQAVLGHEISHIHAQSQGIGTGHSGLYENAALEHQADTEGLMAAQGRSIYSDGAMDMGMGMQYSLGMQGVENITTLGGGMSASAGAPMQALFGKLPTKWQGDEQKNAEDKDNKISTENLLGSPERDPELDNLKVSDDEVFTKEEEDELGLNLEKGKVYNPTEPSNVQNGDTQNEMSLEEVLDDFDNADEELAKVKLGDGKEKYHEGFKKSGEYHGEFFREDYGKREDNIKFADEEFGEDLVDFNEELKKVKDKDTKDFFTKDLAKPVKGRKERIKQNFKAAYGEEMSDFINFVEML